MTSNSATCKKCDQPYTDPRILSCLHSFCTKCIKLLIEEEGSKTIRCPTCETSTSIPEKGIEAIPQNTYLSHQRMVAKLESQIRESSNECSECTRYPPQPIVAFCYTCQFLCKICHEQHCFSKIKRNHKLLRVEDARKSNITEELKQHIPPLPRYCQKHTHEEANFYCTECETFICMKCAITHNREHTCEDLNKVAQKQRDDLSQNILSIVDAIKKLNEAIANGQVMSEKVEQRKAEVNGSIQSAFQELHNAQEKRKEELLDQSRMLAKIKSTKLNIQMKELASLRNDIRFCSEVICEAQKKYTDAQLLSVVTVLRTRLQELMKKFSAMDLQLQDDGTVTTVLETTTLVSEICSFGSINKGQPRDYKSLSKPVMTISGPKKPHSVAVHCSGDIFVTSHHDHCVHVFDKNGRKKKTIGSQGSDNGQFLFPTGIFISEDVVFVADNGNNRVQKLKVTGEFIMNIGTQGSRNAKFYHPCDICFASNGKGYVTEYFSKTLRVFNPNGELSSIVNRQRTTVLKVPETDLCGNIHCDYFSKRANVLSAEAVALDPHENLHVTDYSSKCVRVFSADGNYIHKYGSGQLQSPSGIAIDQNGYSLVGDWERKSLCIFDLRGHFVHSIPTFGNTCGITIDKVGFVYVVDYGSNCVYKY